MKTLLHSEYKLGKAPQKFAPSFLKSAMITLLLLCSAGVWGQQVIGSFPGQDGGFEGQTNDPTTTSSTTSWWKSNAGLTATLNTSGGRSGSKYMSIGISSTTHQTLRGPASANIAASTNYTIQFFYRGDNDGTNSSYGNIRGGVSGNTFQYGAYNMNQNTGTTWTKYEITTSINPGASTTGFAVVSIQEANSSRTALFDIDDVVIYAGAADNTAPNTPGTVTVATNATNPTTSLDLSWVAASGGVDGGGYVVVRYSTAPNADNDPNQNGIYAVDNTTNNGTGSLIGTIRYIGTGLSFTDTGLTPGTTYYYKVYTADKAFNYSTESSANGTTTSLVTTITSAQSGNWSSTSTWAGGVIPTSADNAVIANGHTVTMDTTTGGINTRNSGTTTTVNAGGTLATSVTYINNGTTTVNGSFQLNGGGWVSDAGGTNSLVYGANGTLIFAGTYTANSGNYWPTTNGPVNVTVNASSPLTLGFSRTVSGTFQTAAQVNLPSTLTLNGTAQINPGGYFANSPTYGAASTLVYNATYGVSNEWTGNGAAGVGIPANVTVQAGTVTLPNTDRGVPGNITINAGTGLDLNTTSGDLYLGGNWSNAGTFNPNGRAVFFNGGGTQTITKTGGETFSYLIHNGTGLLRFLNKVTVSANAGDVLQLLSGTIDLNAQTLELSGTGGNVKLSGSQSLNSTVAGATFAITGGAGNKKYIYGGTLSIPTNVTTVLQSGLDFGAGVTTVSGTLRIQSFGFVETNPPTYGSSSTLEYNGVTGYNVGNEWTGNAATAGAGTPQNVSLAGNSSINMPGATRSLAGNLSIGAGSTLNLSTAANADLNIGGNWNNAGTFTPNNKAVFFRGSAAQTITGATTFDYLTINNAAGVTLINSITNNLTLDLLAGKLTLGANDLTIGNSGTITNAAASKYIVTNGTGQLKRTVGATATLFAVGNSAYNPITFTNSGTSDMYGVRVSDTAPAAADATKTVTRRWITTEAVAGGSNLAVVAQYNTGETGSNYNAGTDPFIGYYDGAAYTQVPATLNGSNPFTATSTANLNPADLTSGTKYFAVAKDNGFLSIPYKYVISNITPASPVAGQGFSATVTAQDKYNKVTTLPSASGFALSTNGNAGAISGTVSGTIASGTSSVVVSGIILPNPGTGVTITATNTSGLPLVAGTSATFTVVGVATQLKFMGVPANGTANTNLTSFTVEARRADNTVDTNFSGTITIAKASGPGNISGTLTRTASSGVATFNNIQFDAPGTYTIATTSGTLTNDTSGNIVIAPNPANAYFRTNVATGNWSAPASWQSSNDGVTWATATVAPTSAANVITIRSGNNITLDTSVTLDQLVIANGGQLTVASNTGTLNINNGAGVDVDIQNGGVLQVTGTAGYDATIIFAALSSMNVNGKILVGDGVAANGTNYNKFATSPASQIIWNHGAVFEWNSAGIFGANGETFFPGVSDTIIPIFRFSKGNANAGGGTATVINGLFEINGLTSNWQGDGIKKFRNGIKAIGTAAMVRNTGDGAWQIGDGTSTVTAELGGAAGNLTLTNSNGITLLANSSTSLTSTVNIGSSTKLTVATGAELNFGFDATGNALNLVRSGDTAASTAFAAQAGSTLKITSPDGITSGSTQSYTGNVQIGSTAANRVFDPAATYHYIGKSAAAQVTGNGLPTVTGKVIVEMETAAGQFSASNSKTIDTDGTLEIRTGVVTDDSSNSFTGAGNVVMNSANGRYITSKTGAQPSLSGTYTLTNGTIEFANSQATKATIRVSPDYYNVDVSGSNVESGGKSFVVNNLLRIISPTAVLTIPEETDTANPYVVTARKGIQVVAGGKALFLNNANLLQDVDAVNSGNINMQRKANVPSDQYNYWSSPVIAQPLYSLYDVPANSVMTYNSWNDRFTVLPAAGNPTSVFAKGYSIKGSPTMNPALTAEFVGTPNNQSTTGVNSITLSTAGSNYNLIGNPYPSNLNLLSLYADSDNTGKFYDQEDETPTAYFWDNTSNTDTLQQGSGYVNQNYATLNLSGGVGTSAPRTGLTKKPNGIVKPGQGFIIRAAETGGNLLFKNAYRQSSPGAAGTYFRGAAETNDKFWLILTTPNQMNIQTAISYNPAAENTFERFDSVVFSEAVSENFYSLSSEAKKLAIQGRKGDFAATDVVPLGFKTAVSGVQTISIEDKAGVFAEGQKIYLKDKQLNIIADLTEQAYQFTAPKGVDDNRFEIVYLRETTLGTGDSVKNDVAVYRQGENFIIQSSDKKITEIEIYDMAGRLYQKLRANDAKVIYDGSALANGTYIMKIKRQEETTTRKIIK